MSQYHAVPPYPRIWEEKEGVGVQCTECPKRFSYAVSVYACAEDECPIRGFAKARAAEMQLVEERARALQTALQKNGMAVDYNWAKVSTIGIMQGLQARSEGKMRPLSEVLKELEEHGLG